MIASAYSARPDRSRVVAGRLHVVGDALALGDHGGDGGFEPLRRVGLAEVVEHQLPGEDHRGRVDLVLALVLRRRAVRRLEDGRVGADVPARRDAEAADEAGGQVADDVAVEVRQHEHVELLGPLHETHAERVDEVLPRLDLRDSPSRRPRKTSRKSPSVNFMMFALVTHETRLRPWARAYSNAKRMIRSEPSRLIGLTEMPEPEAICFFCSAVQLGDHLLGFGRAGLVLDAGVEILGVLADDHEVDVVVARAHAVVASCTAAGTRRGRARGGARR